MTKAAFFDLDKTLVPGSSLFLLARGMYQRDYYRVRDMAGFAWNQVMFRLVGSEREQGMEQSKKAALEFVKGKHRDEFAALGNEIVEEQILPRVYEDIARVIRSHTDAGFETFLVTAAPIELARVVSESLGMTGALGTESEFDDAGRYTGRLVGDILHGPEKAKAVQLLALERGIDLSESHAYSDSTNDLPLLETVGHPHAVNPDHGLRRIARTRGWPIHELRARRRALLIGIPSAVAATGLFAGGVALGAWLANRRRTLS
ncbi:MAG TPA: HAD family hydrolase [Actinomycetota bacterium]|nr:HAD family hydrolase [Actinomycetota bacterium]